MENIPSTAVVLQIDFDRGKEESDSDVVEQSRNRQAGSLGGPRKVLDYHSPYLSWESWFRHCGLKQSRLPKADNAYDGKVPGHHAPCPALEGLLIVLERQGGELTIISPVHLCGIYPLCLPLPMAPQLRAREPDLEARPAASPSSRPLSQERDPSLSFKACPPRSMVPLEVVSPWEGHRKASCKENKRSAHGRKGTVMTVPMPSHRSLLHPL